MSTSGPTALLLLSILIATVYCTQEQLDMEAVRMARTHISEVRIYLGAQGITHPLTLASLAGTLLHLPINLLLVERLGLDVVRVFAAAAMGVTASVFATWTRDTWGRMFTVDEEILRLTAATLPVLGLCELGNYPQTVGCGVLSGTVRPSHAANVNLGAFYFVGMPIVVGVAFWLNGGFVGLWIERE